MLVADLVVNSKNYTDKLGSWRKLCVVLAKALGMTKNDLKPNLLAKVEEVVKSGDGTGETAERLYWISLLLYQITYYGCSQ